MTTIVNVAEIASADWHFVERELPAHHHWNHFSAVPHNALERWVPKPRLSRVRACMQAVRQMRCGDEVVISHLPKTTHWLSTAMAWSGHVNRHLAFAFNFTRLPQGGQRERMSASFERVSRFVVYSEFERRRYAAHFGIPIEHIDHLFWSMDTPRHDPQLSAAVAGRYSALGGEGRDYATLVEAFRGLPSLALTIVARPDSLAGIDVPPNVEVRVNVPELEFWSVAHGAKAVIVPLLDEQTPCGHITLVGAMQLGKAIVSTRSEGTEDYLRAEQNALLVAPGDVSALRRALGRIEQDTDLRQRLAANGLRFAQTHCTPRVTERYVEAFIDGADLSAAPAPPASQILGR